MSEEFNPKQFFDMLRKSASVKAGAIMFGEAQLAYYETLKREMPEEQAYNMLALISETIVKGIFAAAPSFTEVILKAAAAYQTLFEQGGKEVPGSGPTNQ